MEVGLRVVRGPDWMLDDVESDGGEGFVGTVVEVGGKSSSLPENLVWVQWDLGIRHDHRAGYYGAYDLCVLDSAPIGIKHEGTQCESCKENLIVGMCWQCVDCSTDCNLCTSCYMADEHSKQHAFQRVDFPGDVGIPVGTRLGARKIQSKGIFPGAKVVRGVDWQWENQDGGDGNEGVVIEFRNWKKSPKRGVHVSWDGAKKNTYRLGVKGKIDLKCVTPGTGGIYYKEHLPKVGEWKHKLRRKEAGASTWASTGTSTGASTGPSTGASTVASESCEEIDKSLENMPGVGDLVCVSLPPDIVKAMNSNIEEWTDNNNRYLGKTGTVQAITSSGVRIVYSDNRVLTFHPDLVAKDNKDTGDRTAVSACNFSRGAAVRIIGEEESLRRLQQGHGPWNDAVRRATGKNGRVLDVTPTGEVEVAIIENGEENVIVFNADALSLKTDGIAANAGGSCPDVVSGETRQELVTDLLQSNQGIGRFLSAAAGAGNVELVEHVLNGNPHLVNYSDDVTHPPLIRACQGGNSVMASLLLTRNADINQQDSQGYRALHHAANRDMSGSTARVLLTFGANLNDTQNLGLSAPLHLAAKESNPETMGVLIDAGCEMNLADSQGFTPLHYSANGDFTGATALRLVENGADVNNTHNDGHLAPLHVAVNGFNRDVVEILIQAGCDANLKDNQGLTALHLAAKRLASEDIAGLLVRGGADLNINTNQGMYTPLHIAVIEQNIQVVEILVQAGCDPNIQSHDGNTAFHEVGRHGNVLVAERLLESPASPDLNIRNQQGLTSFLLLLIRGYKDVAKRIYQTCASVASIPAYGGTTALHFAALYDDEEMLRLILDSGLVNMNSRNKDGLTALDLAKAANQPAAVRLLTSHLDHNGSQLEHCEVERHDFRFGDTVRVRERREVVELMQLSHGGWNPSMTQALGKIGVVEEVLDSGDVRVTVQDFLQTFAVPLVFNPLALIGPSSRDVSLSAPEPTVIDNVATKSEKHEFTLLDPLVEYAFASDSFLDLIPKHSDGLQGLNQDNAGEMLFVACLMRWVIKVQEITSLHPKAVSQGESDHFVLHVCCFTGDFKLVQILLEAGADVTLRDHNRFTPLHTAAMGDRSGDVMNLLLAKGANLNDSDNTFGVTPLHLAVVRNNEAAVRVLVQRRDIQINLQDLEGDTALHVACTLGRDEIVEMMLTVCGINTELFNGKGFLPLHLASKKGQARIVKTLLKHDNRLVNRLTSNEDAMASLHFASNNGDEEIVKVLLSTELCDFHIRNGEGRTPLELANVAHNQNVIALLKHQIKPVETELIESKTVEEGNSSLEDVSTESMPFRTGDVVRIQRNEKFIDPAQRSHDSSGEIGQVVSAGSDVAVLLKGEVVTFKPSELVLVDRESEQKPGDQARVAEAEEIPQKIFRKLVRAVFKDDLPTFVAILTSWPLEINRFFNGTTLLHLASGDGFPRMLRKLIELGANLMAQDRRGLTPLHIAAARDRTGIGASILLEKLADPNFQSSRSNNRTALHFAVLFSNTEVAKQLIGSQCDVNRKDGRGNTPLHVAIEFGNEQIAELIIEAEMYDPLSRNSEGLIGLHQAVIRRNKHILKTLLVRSPSVVNEPTLEGDRAIHLAAAKGFDEIAKMLIDKGECRLNVRNRGKKFPHDVAESSGHEDLARLLWDEHDRLFPGIRHSGEPTPESGEMRMEAEHGTEAERVRSSTPHEDDAIPDRLLCCICLEKQKNITFQCGHLNTCWECAHKIKECPECKAVIKSRLTTYY